MVDRIEPIGRSTMGRTAGSSPTTLRSKPGALVSSRASREASLFSPGDKLMRPSPKFRALLPALASLVGLSLAPAAGDARPQLLVLNKSGDTLAFVNPATMKVESTIGTGHAPHEIAVSADGATAYVANYGTPDAPGSTLTVVDVRKRAVSRTLDLGPYKRPHGIKVGGDGKIRVTSEESKALLLVDPSTGRVERAIETGQLKTHMVVLTPDGARSFTANVESGTVSAIERDGKITQIPVGKGPEGIDVRPDGKEVWVAHRGDGGLSIIDVSTLKVTRTIDGICRQPIRVRFTPDGRSALVSCFESNEVLDVDPSSREIRRRIPMGKAPIGILITADSRTAFVANTAADTVSVLDLAEGKMTGTFSPGREPDGMAWGASQGD